MQYFTVPMYCKYEISLRMDESTLKKGSGDIFENGEKVVNSCMKIRFIACGYQTHFYYLQEGSSSLLKRLSHVVGTLLEGLT